MRIAATAILLTCGVGLLSCNDSTSSDPTQSRLPVGPSLSAAEAPLINVGGNHDFVVGSGESAAIESRFHVSAHSGPLGEDPKGHVKVESGTLGPVEGKVTCVFVAGNRAAVGIENTMVPGESFYVVAEDNGDGTEVPDRYGEVTSLASNLCSTLATQAFFTALPVTKGNITIVGAIPPLI